jgi:tetratricopeptide (TPR) repeat protein
MKRPILPVVLFGLYAAASLLAQSPPDSSKTTSAPGAPPVSDADTLVLAEKLYGQGDYAAALAQYQALLPAHPKWPKIYSGLARVYLKQGKVQEASDAVAKGLEQADSPAIRIALGEVDFRQGKIFEAEQEWAKVINSGNEEARAYLGMARVSHANSMYKRSNTLIDKAHELDPQDPDIRRYWIGTRSRQERIKDLEAELLQIDAKSERRIHLQHALDLLKSTQGQNCRLVGNITSTETPLVRLMRDADHPRGVGLAVGIDGEKSKLMLDTGSSGILINQKLADKAGIARIVDTEVHGIGDQNTRSYLGIAKSIKIGQLEFQNCAVGVIDERNLLSEDGFIGTDVFESFLIEIDVPGGKLRLSELPKRPSETPTQLSLHADGESGQEGDDPQLSSTASGNSPNSAAGKSTGPQDRYIAPEMKAYTPVFRFGHDLLIPTKIGDVPAKLFAIDTGSFRTIVSPDAAREITRIHGNAFDRVKGVSGEAKKVYDAETVVFQFGHLREKGRNIPSLDISKFSESTGTEISGFLGFIDILQYLDIKLDYRDGLVDFAFTTAPINQPGCGPASYPCN